MKTVFMNMIINVCFECVFVNKYDIIFLQFRFAFQIMRILVAVSLERHEIRL